MNIRSVHDIKDLANDPRSLELFGPGTSDTCLILAIEDKLDEKVSDYLFRLPCPVIGIDRGATSLACDVIISDTSKLEKLHANIQAAPIAAMVLVQHLRASETQSMQDALIAESLAYGILQNGPEFNDWLNRTSSSSPSPAYEKPITLFRRDDGLDIKLSHPENGNAVNRPMRDALCEALDIAIIDDTISTVSLSAQGATFSIGGDISEFGSVSDPATAHWIRTLRQPAHRLAELSSKLHVHINGAAIGAGAEMAAFGTRLTASSRAWFQLPELKFGLIPGAGGTVSLPRRIGRQKTAFLALSMARIRAQKALEWGLIDSIED